MGVRRGLYGARGRTRHCSALARDREADKEKPRRLLAGANGLDVRGRSRRETRAQCAVPPGPTEPAAGPMRKGIEQAAPAHSLLQAGYPARSPQASRWNRYTDALPGRDRPGVRLSPCVRRKSQFLLRRSHMNEDINTLRRILKQNEDHRRGGPVGQLVAAELLRRQVPAGARLPRSFR